MAPPPPVADSAPARHAKLMAEISRPHGFIVVMSSHRINHFLMVDASPQRDDVWFWHARL